MPGSPSCHSATARPGSLTPSSLFSCPSQPGGHLHAPETCVSVRVTLLNKAGGKGASHGELHPQSWGRGPGPPALLEAHPSLGQSSCEHQGCGDSSAPTALQGSRSVPLGSSSLPRLSHLPRHQTPRTPHTAWCVGCRHRSPGHQPWPAGRTTSMHPPSRLLFGFGGYLGPNAYPHARSTGSRAAAWFCSALGAFILSSLPPSAAESWLGAPRQPSQCALKHRGRNPQPPAPSFIRAVRDWPHAKPPEARPRCLQAPLAPSGCCWVSAHQLRGWQLTSFITLIKG